MVRLWRSRIAGLPVAGILSVFVLLAMYFVAIQYRVRLGKHPDYYNPDDPTAYYWTENALQYHYAELVARGEGIPVFDDKLQAPEGVRTFENLTILMEYPAGWFYRFSRMKDAGIEFHTWTILFIALCNSLIIFAVYFFSRVIGINRFYSIVAGFLASFSLVAVGRTIFSFLNEDFVLPLLFSGLAFYFYALRSNKRSVVFALIAGLFFSLSLAGWHLSRFILLGVVGCSVLNMWVLTKNPQDRYHGSRVLLLMLAIPFTCSFLIPVLQSRMFFLSSTFFLGFGSALGILFIKNDHQGPLVISKRGWVTILPGVLLLALSLFVTALLKLEGEYGHVWSLLINKIRYCGIKPAVPSLIDYAARSLWVEAFNSPHPVTLFKDLFPIIIPAVIGFIYLVRTQKNRIEVRLLLVLSALYFLLYLAIERMGIILNFFVSVLSVSMGMAIFKKQRKWKKFIMPAALLLIIIFNFYQGSRIHEPTQYVKTLRQIIGSERTSFVTNWRLNDVELVRFIRVKTPADAIFLSRFSVDPLVLAYAGRPIALQPKFEVKGCQERVKEYLDAVFDSEEKFYSLCRRWQVSYFVYDVKIILDNSADADRWVADRMTVAPRSAAYLMQFFPEKLNHFEIVYQNNFYRLFRVLNDSERPAKTAFAYQPVYDIARYGGQDSMRSFDDRFTREIYKQLEQAKALLQRSTQILVRNPAEAARLMERSREIYPSLIGSATTLGIAYVLQDRVDDGLTLCQEEVVKNPLLPLGRYNLAYAFVVKGDLAAARVQLTEALSIDPNYTAAKTLMDQIEDK